MTAAIGGGIGVFGRGTASVPMSGSAAGRRQKPSEAVAAAASRATGGLVTAAGVGALPNVNPSNVEMAARIVSLPFYLANDLAGAR